MRAENLSRNGGYILKTQRLTELVILARQGDWNAMQELYLDANKSVYHLALRIVRNTEDAEDITQEVFITVHEKISGLREPGAFYKWLNQVTVSKSNDFLRKYKGIRAFGGDEELLTIIDDDPNNLPDKAIDDEETRRIILGVIDELPDSQRVCIILYYYTQYPIAQIANMLETNENTVKSRLALARAKIRAALEEKERTEGIRLYGIPLALTPILRQTMQDFVMPEGAEARIWENIKRDISKGLPAKTGGNAGPGGAAGAVVKAGMTLATKIIIGVVGAAVIAAAIIAAGVFFIPRLVNAPTDPEPPGRSDRQVDVTSNSAFMSEDIYFSISDVKNIVFDNGMRFVSNEALLYAADGVSKSEMETLAEKYGGTVVGVINAVNLYQVQLDRVYSYNELEELIGRVAKNEQVESGEVNYAFQLDTHDFPNDSEWAGLWNGFPDGLNWGAKAINAPGAWAYRASLSNVNIGIIDNQFYIEHEDLRHVFTDTFPYVYDKDKTYHFDSEIEGASHGTHVAGTIGAEYNNGIGIAGIYPGVYSESSDKNEAHLFGVSRRGCSSLEEKTGIEYTTSMGFQSAFAYLIVEKRCKVVNICMGLDFVSFAVSRGNGEAAVFMKELNRTLGSFLRRLFDYGNDFVICKSAGNQNRFTQDGNGYIYVKVDEDDGEYGYIKYSTYNNDLERYSAYADDLDNRLDWGNIDAICDFISGITEPDVRDRIIVVGAVQRNMEIVGDLYEVAGFSQTGNRVDVLAPGVNIYSTVYINGGSGYDNKNWSGTSMAAPHVSGVAAMVWGVNPGLTGAKVKEIIIDTATGSYPSQKYKNGDIIIKPLVDAKAAVERALLDNPFVKVIAGEQVGNHIFLKASPNKIEIRDLDNIVLNTLSIQGDIHHFITDGNVVIYLLPDGNNMSLWRYDVESSEHRLIAELAEKELIPLLGLKTDSSGELDTAHYENGLRLFPSISAADDRRLFIRFDWNDGMRAVVYLNFFNDMFVPLLEYSDVSIDSGKLIFKALKDGNKLESRYIADRNLETITKFDNVYSCRINGDNVFYFQRINSSNAELRVYNLTTNETRILERFTIDDTIEVLAITAITDDYICYFRRSTRIYDTVFILDLETDMSKKLVVAGTSIDSGYFVYFELFQTDDMTFAVAEATVYVVDTDTKELLPYYAIPSEYTNHGLCRNVISTRDQTYLVMPTTAQTGYRSVLIPK